MPLAPWAGAYIGLPYRAQGRTRHGCDCWGLVRLVYAEIYGVALPSYAAGYDLDRGRAGWPEVTQTIAAGLAQWHPVDRPDARIGDGIVFRVANHPLHVGLLVGTGPRRVLHMEQGIDSVIEPLDGIVWGHRIGGFYRCTGAAA